MVSAYVCVGGGEWVVGVASTREERRYGIDKLTKDELYNPPCSVSHRLKQGVNSAQITPTR